MTNRNDKELTRIISKKGQDASKAFEELYERYSRKLNAYCRFRAATKELAEEVFEDTWLKFLDQVKKGKLVNNALPYLFVIARNLIINRYRQKNSQIENNVFYTEQRNLELLLSSEDTLNRIENDELLEIIKSAAETLDDIYRDTFIMYWFGGLSLREIAEITGEKLSNIKMRNNRAMEKMLKKLKPYIRDLNHSG